MAPPPAKRQKRLVVLSSDDDDGDLQADRSKISEALETVELSRVNGNAPLAQRLPNRSRRKLAAPSKAPPRPTSSDTTPTSSPNKPKKNAKLRQKDHKSESLYTFFTARAQTQRDRPPSESRRPDLEEEEFIEDDSLDEDLRQLDTSRPGPYHALDPRKSGRLSPGQKRGQLEAETLPNASQRFLRLPKQTQSNFHKEDGSKVLDEDGRPWPEKYSPTNLEELAVHKKKVSDVRNWLEHVLDGRSRKVRCFAESGRSRMLTRVAETPHSEGSLWNRQNYHSVPLRTWNGV